MIVIATSSVSEPSSAGSFVALVAVVAEQRAIGHHEVDLERNIAGLRLTGESLDGGVGHDLTARAAIALFATEPRIDVVRADPRAHQPRYR